MTGVTNLNLGGLVFLLLALLQGKWPLDDILADIIVLLQVEELPDLAGSLGSQSSWDGVVSKSGNLVVSLLDNSQVENSQVSINNTSTDRLAPTLTSASCSVAAVTLVEEEPHTSIGQHTLLHGESLLVISSGNPDNVSFELISESVSINLLSHSLFIERSHFPM